MKPPWAGWRFVRECTVLTTNNVNPPQADARRLQAADERGGAHAGAVARAQPAPPGAHPGVRMALQQAGAWEVPTNLSPETKLAILSTNFLG